MRESAVNANPALYKAAEQLQQLLRVLQDPEAVDPEEATPRSDFFSVKHTASKHLFRAESGTGSARSFSSERSSRGAPGVFAAGSATTYSVSSCSDLGGVFLVPDANSRSVGSSVGIACAALHEARADDNHDDDLEGGSLTLDPSSLAAFEASPLPHETLDDFAATKPRGGRLPDSSRQAFGSESFVAMLDKLLHVQMHHHFPESKLYEFRDMLRTLSERIQSLLDLVQPPDSKCLVQQISEVDPTGAATQVDLASTLAMLEEREDELWQRDVALQQCREDLKERSRALVLRDAEYLDLKAQLHKANMLLHGREEELSEMRRQLQYSRFDRHADFKKISDIRLRGGRHAIKGRSGAAREGSPACHTLSPQVHPSGERIPCLALGR